MFSAFTCQYSSKNNNLKKNFNTLKNTSVSQHTTETNADFNKNQQQKKEEFIERVPIELLKEVREKKVFIIFFRNDFIF
jgi:hypothetical protein